MNSTYFDVREEDDILKNREFDSCAVAFASKVFPVPLSLKSLHRQHTVVQTAKGL